MENIRIFYLKFFFFFFFLVVKFSVYLNTHIFVMKSALSAAMNLTKRGGCSLELAQKIEL